VYSIPHVDGACIIMVAIFSDIVFIISMFVRLNIALVNFQ